MNPATSCAFKPLESHAEYNRHEPSKTLLYQIVQNHMLTFLDQCDASDRAAAMKQIVYTAVIVLSTSSIAWGTAAQKEILFCTKNLGDPCFYPAISTPPVS